MASRRSLENIHTSNVTQTEQVVCVCLVMRTHMCVKSMNEKSNHGFEIEQRRINGKVWKEDKDGGMKKSYYPKKKKKKENDF